MLGFHYLLPGTMKRAVAVAQREEEELMRLQAVAVPSHMALYNQEVERRADIFRKVWMQSRCSGGEYTPRAAAAHSVAEDITRGWI